MKNGILIASLLALPLMAAAEFAVKPLTEAQARETHGGNLEVVRIDYAGNDRAIAERRTTGFLKVMVVRGRPVGASMVGAQAGENADGRGGG